MAIESGRVSGSGESVFVGGIEAAGDIQTSGSLYALHNISGSGKGFFVTGIATAGSVFATGSIYSSGSFSGSGKGFFYAGLETAGSLYATGSVYITGSLAAKGNVSGSGKGLFVGGIETAGSVYATGSMYSSGSFSGSGKGFFQEGLETAGSLYATGSLYITGSLYAKSNVSGSGKGFFVGGIETAGYLNVTGSTAVSGNMYLADDKKFYFGANNDASIEYDEAGSNKLILSGAAGGFMIQVPDNVGAGLEIKEGANTYVTVATTNGQEGVSFGKRLILLDDTAIAFGTGQDATVEYDENGTDELRFAGAAVTFEQDVTFDNDVTLGVAATDTTTVTGQLTASEGLLVPDDKKLYFGTGTETSIEYGENDGNFLVISGSHGANYTGGVALSGSVVKIETDAWLPDEKKLYFGTGRDGYIAFTNPGGGIETVLSVGSSGGAIQIPDDEGASFEINEAGNTYMRFNTGNTYADVRCPKPFGVMDDVTLNIGTPAAAGVPATLEYDANGTQELVISPPPNGMSVGSGFHRIAVDLDITKADSGDNDVANQLFMIDGSTPVKIPNDAVITRVVAVTKALSNLGTALYNIQISATSATAADSAISSGTELLGAGGSGTADSNGGSASDITMSSGGVLKKVWYNETIVKTTYDAYVYVCNAGTGNGTTDPATGTLTIIIEYYGID